MKLAESFSAVKQFLMDACTGMDISTIQYRTETLEDSTAEKFFYSFKRFRTTRSADRWSAVSQAASLPQVKVRTRSALPRLADQRSAIQQTSGLRYAGLRRHNPIECHAIGSGVVHVTGRRARRRQIGSQRRPIRIGQRIFLLDCVSDCRRRDQQW